MTITSIDDPRYIKALGHPLRVRILALLEEEVSSPVQLSKKLGASLGTVAYHVRTLHELGLLQDVGTTPRRGAVEHHYKALPRPHFSDDAWEGASPIAKQALTDATLIQILDYCRISAAAGGFDRREAVVTRTAMRLDERGWEELSAAYNALLDSMDRIESEAGKRLDAGDGELEAMDVGAVLMLFEAQRFSDQPEGSALGSLVRDANGRDS